MVSNFFIFFYLFILYSFFSSSNTSTRDHNENKAIRACLVPSLPSSILLVNYLYTNIFIYDFLSPPRIGMVCGGVWYKSHAMLCLRSVVECVLNKAFPRYILGKK